jgi:hypothetical protein
VNGSSRPPASVQRQQLLDPDHRCNYSQIPHLLLDDVAAGRLHPASVVLYLHYRRATFEQHGRPVDETLRETKHRTGLSNGTILTARGELETVGWLAIEKDGNRSGQSVTITLTERWEDNCEHQGHLGQKLTKSEELGQKPAKFGQKPAKFGRKLTKSHLSDDPFKTVEDREDPLGGGMIDGSAARTAPLPTMALIEVSAPRQSSALAPNAEELLAGFYRGLGVELSELTANVRRRDVAIARDLIAVGATPEEAEACAREARLITGRLAPLDLRWFERERPGWLTRRRHPQAAASRSAYEWDPWEGRKPPISEADLARGAAL